MDRTLPKNLKCETCYWWLKSITSKESKGQCSGAPKWIETHSHHYCALHTAVKPTVPEERNDG